MNDRTSKSFLLTMAVGDAYGMAYEFVEDMNAVGPNDLSAYRAHPTFTDYEAGRYTDDTQKALANAEILLRPNADTSAAAFAQAYVDAFKRDPRRGYSQFMYDTLSQCTDGRDFVARLNPTKGVTSGAAMGAAPFGLLPIISLVKDITRRQARITHDTPTGILSAQAVALAVHYCHYKRGPLHKLPEFLNQSLDAGWRTLDETNDPRNGLFSVRRALRAVVRNNSLARLLKDCVDYGPKHDTDTICAIAMAVASRAADYVDDLPLALITGLENGAYGRDYLRAVDRALLLQFPGPAASAAPKLQP